MCQILKCLTVIFSGDTNISFWEIYIERFQNCWITSSLYATKVLRSVSNIYQNPYRSFGIIRFTINKDQDEKDHSSKRFLARKISRNRFRRTKIKNCSVEIKNIIKSTNSSNISRFNLKLCAFVYDAMIDFPPSNFMYDTITINNFFRIVYCLIIVKVYLHHYREDFWKIDREDFVFWYVFLYKRLLCNCMGYKRFKYWWNKFKTYTLWKYCRKY